MKAAFQGFSILLVALFIATANSARADEVIMENGDRYTGKVVSMDDNTVILNNDTLGRLRIRRDKVTSITLGAKSTEAAAASPSTSTTAVPQTSKAPRVATLTARAEAMGPNPAVNLNSSPSHQLATNPHLVEQVRNDVLTGAGPKAAAKFDELVNGLSTGKINIAELRKQAESVATQLRQLRGKEDEETAEILDEYLSVLDQFVRSTGATSSRTSNPAQMAPAKKPSSPAPAQKPVSAR